MELDDEEGEQRLRDDEEDEEEDGRPQGWEEGGVSYVQPTWGGPRSTSHLSSRGSLHSTRRGWATSSSSSTAPPSFTSSAAVTYYASPPTSTTSATSSTSFTSRRSAGLGASTTSTAASAPRHQPQPQARPSGSDLTLRCAYSYATDDESPVPQPMADDEGDVWVVGDVRDAYYSTPYGNTPSPTTAASGGGDDGVEWRRDPYAYCLDGDEPGGQMGYVSGGRGEGRKGRSAPGMTSMATTTTAYGGSGHAAEGGGGGATKKPERRKLSLSATLNQKTSYDGECERDWNALLQSILELHEDTLERRAKKVKGELLFYFRFLSASSLPLISQRPFNPELQRLCLDFSEVVCRFGELIIREIVLDDDDKTLKVSPPLLTLIPRATRV